MHLHQLNIICFQVCLLEGIDDRTSWIFACRCQMTGANAYGGVFQVSVRGEESVVDEHDCNCGGLSSVSDVQTTMNFLTLFYLC